MTKSLIALIFFISYSIVLSGQHQSIHLNLYGSDYLGNNFDDEYDYETVFASKLAQFSADYHCQMGKKISVYGSVGYSFSSATYINKQTTLLEGPLEDRTFHEKNQKIGFLKIGSGVSYWFKSVGRGPYAKGEILANFILAAKSEEEKQVDKGPKEKFEVNYKNDINTFVPSFKMGVGYSLLFGKKFSVNVGIFFELRTSSYFKDADGYDYFNKGFEFGIGYILNTNE